MAVGSPLEIECTALLSERECKKRGTELEIIIGVIINMFLTCIFQSSPSEKSILVSRLVSQQSVYLVGVYAWPLGGGLKGCRP